MIYNYTKIFESFIEVGNNGKINNKREHIIQGKIIFSLFFRLTNVKNSNKTK